MATIISNTAKSICDSPGTSGIALDKAGSAKVVFDKANLFARALGVDLGSTAAKRVQESEKGKLTLNCAVECWGKRIMAKERRAAIAIATKENAAAARQWLELNGYRWQNGEFKTAYGPLRRIRKPVHPDEAGARALYSLLYGAEQPRQERLTMNDAINE